MMAVCYKEGIKITPNALDAVIEGAHQDLRQTLHNLYMWTVNKKSISFDEAKVQSATAEKDSIKVGPFDAVREMFQPPKGHLPGSAVIEKIDLYFEDYNFVPLFVQENYLSVNIHGVKDKYEVLDRISRTADSLSLSDLIDREIRGRQNWSLLPIHVSLKHLGYHVFVKWVCVSPNRLFSPQFFPGISCVVIWEEKLIFPHGWARTLPPTRTSASFRI